MEQRICVGWDQKGGSEFLKDGGFEELVTGRTLQRVFLEELSHKKIQFLRILNLQVKYWIILYLLREFIKILSFKGKFMSQHFM